MDQKERYVTLLLRKLVRSGVITFVGSMGGALAIGPAGYALGPVLAVTLHHLGAITEEEQIARPLPTRNEIIFIAMQFGIELLINNIPEIISIAKDIIRLLQRLLNTKEESVTNAKMLLHYEPCN
ncbi:uncharacterized protein [Rhodnius prolixus]|uniref:Uncharacterized protein n=2 Tax=Rhodnius TaxID=13248 RepID=T1HIP6_RHOPR